MNTMGKYIILHPDFRYHLLLMKTPLFTLRVHEELLS